MTIAFVIFPQELYNFLLVIDSILFRTLCNTHEKIFLCDGGLSYYAIHRLPVQYVGGKKVATLFSLTDRETGENRIIVLRAFVYSGKIR